MTEKEERKRKYAKYIFMTRQDMFDELTKMQLEVIRLEKMLEKEKAEKLRAEMKEIKRLMDNNLAY
jgi:hypothetical protein